MSEIEIRKLVTIVEETRRELNRPVEPASRHAAAIAVISNPVSYTHLTLPTNREV
mgnify:CR=1 FL=1